MKPGDLITPYSTISVANCSFAERSIKSGWSLVFDAGIVRAGTPAILISISRPFKLPNSSKKETEIMILASGIVTWTFENLWTIVQPGLTSDTFWNRMF